MRLRVQAGWGLLKPKEYRTLVKSVAKKAGSVFLLGKFWQFGIFSILLGRSTWLRAVGHLPQSSGPICDRFLVGEDLKWAHVALRGPNSLLLHLHSPALPGALCA